MSTTQNSRVIHAPADILYHALTDPKALETWQAPGYMTAKMHQFDLKVGGGYTMSLFYPEQEGDMKGKTSLREDRFTIRFLELSPRKIVEAASFDTADPQFGGEMKITISLEPVQDGTKISFLFTDIPAGIRPEDNEAGTASSLEKLARYVEAGRR